MSKKRSFESVFDSQEMDTQPSKKQKQLKCKFGCNRTIAPGTTKRGNTFDTCCQQCAVSDSKNAQHSSQCNERNSKQSKNNSNVSILDEYKFKPVAKKYRCNCRHGEQTGCKQIVIVSRVGIAKDCNIDGDDYSAANYYVRVWKGLNYNNGITLIHKLKFVSNDDQLKLYIKEFDYQMIGDGINSNDNDYNDNNDHDDDIKLSNKDKLYIVNNIINNNIDDIDDNCKGNNEMNKFIKFNKGWNSKCVDIYDTEPVLPGSRFDSHVTRMCYLTTPQVIKNGDEKKRNENTNTIGIDEDEKNVDYNMFKSNFYDLYALSDIDTNSSLILSNCSGDTDFEVKFGLLKGEFQDFMKKHGIDNLPFRKVDDFARKFRKTSKYINDMSQQEQKEFDKNISQLDDELFGLEEVIYQDIVIKRKFDKLLVKHHDDDIDNDDLNQSKRLFYSIWFKTEWNENGLKLPFIQAIKQGIISLFEKDRGINKLSGNNFAFDFNIFELISDYIAIAPSQKDLEMRRIKFWKDKGNYLENKYGKGVHFRQITQFDQER